MTGFVVTLWNLAEMLCDILAIASSVINGVLTAAEQNGKINSSELDTVLGWLAAVNSVCAILKKVVF